MVDAGSLPDCSRLGTSDHFLIPCELIAPNEVTNLRIHVWGINNYAFKNVNSARK